MMDATPVSPPVYPRRRIEAAEPRERVVNVSSAVKVPFSVTRLNSSGTQTIGDAKGEYEGGRGAAVGTIGVGVGDTLQVPSTTAEFDSKSLRQ